jgi:hypothetical protein
MYGSFNERHPVRRRKTHDQHEQGERPQNGKLSEVEIGGRL